MDRKIPILKYNNRMFYYCFNDPFTDDFGSLDFNLPPITFDDRTHPHKRALYTLDLLPANIFVASESYFITLTTPSDLPDIIPTDGPHTLHVIKIGVLVLGRVHRGY